MSGGGEARTRTIVRIGRLNTGTGWAVSRAKHREEAGRRIVGERQIGKPGRGVVVTKCQA